MKFFFHFYRHSFKTFKPFRFYMKYLEQKKLLRVWIKQKSVLVFWRSCFLFCQNLLRKKKKRKFTSQFSKKTRRFKIVATFKGFVKHCCWFIFKVMDVCLLLSSRLFCSGFVASLVFIYSVVCLFPNHLLILTFFNQAKTRSGIIFRRLFLFWLHTSVLLPSSFLQIVFNFRFQCAKLWVKILNFLIKNFTFFCLKFFYV